MSQLVQLFVNGTIAFSDMTDDVDALVVKVDGTPFLSHTNESPFTFCSAGKHLIPKLDIPITKLDIPMTCLYCLHAENKVTTNGETDVTGNSART